MMKDEPNDRLMNRQRGDHTKGIHTNCFHAFPFRMWYFWNVSSVCPILLWNVKIITGGMIEHNCGENKVRIKSAVMITRMKNSIYIIIQTEKLLEGLLFMGPSCGKYLKEDISARHVRASLTLKHINPPLSPHPIRCPLLSHFCRMGNYVADRCSLSVLIEFKSWWLIGGKLVTWGQDCGNWQELSMVAIKSENFSLRNRAATLITASSFRSSQKEQKFGAEARGTVPFRPPPHALLLAMPKTRRSVPPPKKAETSRQGRTSSTRPILSLAGLLNKDQTHRACTSQGLLYNRSLCYCCWTHSAVRMQRSGEASAVPDSVYRELSLQCTSHHWWMMMTEVGLLCQLALHSGI